MDPTPRRACAFLRAFPLLLAATVPAVPTAAQQPPPLVAPQVPGCDIDLGRLGSLRDVLSNALTHGFGRAESEVAGYLRGAALDFTTGDALLADCAQHFAIPVTELAAGVERYRHCNCDHAAAAPTAGPATEPLTGFACDVALHVVLHELGHALVREFDLPVLGNEETLSDAFATHFLVRHLPERALPVLRARITSWLVEAAEVPRGEWTVCGEHDNDARRAFQVAALAIAADPQRYAELATLVGMSDEDARRATDYGAEIHRSWRRVLAPVWMPPGERSREARVVVEVAAEPAAQLVELGLVAAIEDVVARFDWHSQVTVRFVDGDGGAGWSRSSRTITVHSAYLQRFVGQGRATDRATVR